MKKHDQRYQTSFLGKYGGISLYDIDIESRCAIYDEEIYFAKGDGYDSIGKPDHPDGTSTDHEYFCIHDELFDRILETDQNFDIILKMIHKEPSISSINDNSTGLRSKIRIRSEMVPPRHQLQRK